jgi:transcriptional regulator with XRE-family HTH domain
MSHKLTTYLRTHRKRSGLTQDELAFLLGYRNGDQVSRFEWQSRKLNVETAFGFQAVFGVPAHELLPGSFAEVEHNIIERANLLSRRLRLSADTSRTRQKLRFLAAVVARDRTTRLHIWTK